MAECRGSAILNKSFHAMQKSLAPCRRRRSNRPGNSQATGLHRPDNLERGAHHASTEGDTAAIAVKALRYLNRWGAVVIRPLPSLLLEVHHDPHRRTRR